MRKSHRSDKGCVTCTHRSSVRNASGRIICVSLVTSPFKAEKRDSGTYFQILSQHLLYTYFDLVFVCYINAQPGLYLSLVVLFLGHTKVIAHVSFLVTTTPLTTKLTILVEWTGPVEIHPPFSKTQCWAEKEAGFLV